MVVCLMRTALWMLQYHMTGRGACLCVTFSFFFFFCSRLARRWVLWRHAFQKVRAVWIIWLFVLSAAVRGDLFLSRNNSKKTIFVYFFSLAEWQLSRGETLVSSCAHPSKEMRLTLQDMLKMLQEFQHDKKQVKSGVTDMESECPALQISPSEELRPLIKFQDLHSLFFSSLNESPWSLITHSLHDEWDGKHAY